MSKLEGRFRRIMECAQQNTNVRFESYEGGSGRILSARLQPGTDLVTGIKSVVAKHRILAGAVTVSFGSLASAEVSWSEGSQPDPARQSERVQIEGPVSFLTSQGKVGISDDGEPLIHLHGVLCDPEGRVWGGHFYEGNNPVFSTFEIVIHEIVGLRHTKIWDDESEVKLLKAQRLNDA